MASRVAAVVLTIAGLLAVAPTASASLSDTPDNIWSSNGNVLATARSADRIYVGGDFTRVAPQVGGFARFTGGSDQLLVSPPRPTRSSGASASVFSVVDDGAGGFYLGGRFDAVGGVARHDLAHILADGSLDPTFAPDPDGDVTVLARSGGTIYAAGGFTTIGGAARTHVAAIDASGHATTWAPVLDSTPNAIAVASSTVYLGGTFTTINGAARPRAGAVDASTARRRRGTRSRTASSFASRRPALPSSSAGRSPSCTAPPTSSNSPRSTRRPACRRVGLRPLPVRVVAPARWSPRSR